MSRRNLILVGAVFGLAVVLLMSSPRILQRIKSGATTLLTPFVTTGSQLQENLSSFTEGLQSIDQLEEQNRTLGVRNQQLEAQMQMLRGLEEENRRLREQLEYKQRVGFEMIPARVIGRTASTWWTFLIIDAGSERGLQTEMPVLTENGLVGKIAEVESLHSKVLLLTSETCRVAARIEGTGENGIVHGDRVQESNEPTLNLDHISRQAEITIGARVYSSGLGQVFPAGVLLGTVREVTRRDLDLRVRITPSVDFSSIQDVFVVDMESLEELVP